jgi:predicted TIM-barrel fold metal-dependent hydrolase
MAKKWIDAHGHFATPGKSMGRAPGLAATARAWTFAPETSIDYMDKSEVAAQIISNCNQMASLDAIRASNDYGASLVAKYPTRFGFLAQLPMEDPASAVAEIRRGIDELGAEGWAVLTNYDKVYLGDPRFEPVWAELDRMEATLFIHPTTRGFEATRLGRTSALIESPIDTARTVVDMIFAGVFRRYQRFNVILAHGGGALPSLAERVITIGAHELGWVENPHKITAPEMRESFARLYYDTGLAGTAASLDSLLDVTTSDHILYGADFGAPCTHISVCDHHLAATRGYERLTPAQREAIGTNVLWLYPRFAKRIGMSADRNTVPVAAE